MASAAGPSKADRVNDSATAVEHDSKDGDLIQQGSKGETPSAMTESDTRNEHRGSMHSAGSASTDRGSAVGCSGVDGGWTAAESVNTGAGADKQHIAPAKTELSHGTTSCGATSTALAVGAAANGAIGEASVCARAAVSTSTRATTVSDLIGQLNEAARAGQLSTVRRLLSSGLDLAVTSTAGGTALALASFEGHLPVVELLLDTIGYGGLEATDNAFGRTALQLASWRGHVSVVERLLSAGADAEAKDKVGQTALLMASQRFSWKSSVEVHATKALLMEAIAIGSRQFRANRMWPRRRQVTLWRVGCNYTQRSIE